MVAAQHFGRTLFNAVFAGPVSVCFHRSLEAARSQNQGMRLRLRLNDAPTLTDLPWEFLFDTLHNHFLAYSTTTPLVRYLDLPQGGGPLAVAPPLKILVMIANPRDYGYEPLNVEAEWQKVQRALADLEGQGLVEVTRLETATLAALQRQLRRDQYHIFHFVGHGGFDEASQSGVLLLEDETGRSRTVSGYYLGALLRDHFSLRLALLNACEGARTSRVDPFAGVAQHLVQQGIPAVIAMQFEITDGAAITLAHEFYGAVADGYPVDAALSEARKALYAAENDIEWGTPVLYMRAVDGALFDVAAVDSVTEQAAIGLAATHPSDAAPEFSVETTQPSSPVRQLSSVPRTNAQWRRPALFVSLVVLGLLLGLSALTTRFLPFFRTGGDNTQTPTTVAAIIPTFESTTVLTSTSTNVAVAPTTTLPIAPTNTATAAATPTLTPTPNRAATQTAVAGVTADAAAVATAQVFATATSDAATVAAMPTSTATATPPPTHTATALPTHTPTPRPTHTATLQPTSTPTFGIGSTKIVTIAADVTATFLYIPAGEFRMGSTEAEIDEAFEFCKQFSDSCSRDWFIDEAPQQIVDVNTFWIMQTEVTNAQFAAFVDAGGYSQDQWWTEAGWAWRTESAITEPGYWDNTNWNQPDYPVVGISWYEAMAYAAWLADKTGFAVRLPTEAEWEKGARGAESLIFPWGNTWDGTLLNYCDENCTYDWKDVANNDGYTTTAPVGSYPGGASPYGALDVAGNVWEWTSSQFADYPYDSTDGREDLTGSAGRVLRGGSWGSLPFNVRAAVRVRDVPDFRFSNVGVRLVLAVAPR